MDAHEKTPVELGVVTSVSEGEAPGKGNSSAESRAQTACGWLWECHRIRLYVAVLIGFRWEEEAGRRGRNRTCNPELRRLVLYPIELLAH